MIRLTDKSKKQINKSLNAARTAKNDEFYTLYEDIENELKHYSSFLEGKVIYCNCDNPFKSNFVKFFLVNFNYLKIKRLYATCYSPVNIQENLFSDNILVNDKAYFLEVNKVDNDFKKEQELKLILDNVLENRENILSELKGNGSFDSEECLSILDKSDIVITNPPFSKKTAFFRILLQRDREEKIDFLIMSDQTIFGGTFAVDYVLQRKLFSGINKPKQFQTYDGFKNFGSIEWATSFDISSKKDFSLLKLSRRYRDNPSFYKKYDNYNAIECSCLSDVPVDFEGIIGVPITFVKYKHIFDKEGFALLWQTRLIFPGYYLHNTDIFDYLEYDDRIMPSPGEVYRKPLCILDGKVCYHRFFIQKKEYCTFKFPPVN